jgi:hypothetical protein
MLATVKLHDQAFFKADKIHDVISQRLLTAKLEAGKSFGPQLPP